MLFSASFALSRNPWKHLAAEPKNTQSPITQERPTTGKRPPPVCLSRSAVRPIRAKHGRDNKHRSDFPNESRKIFKCAESPLPLTAYSRLPLAIVTANIFSAMPKTHPLTEQCALRLSGGTTFIRQNPNLSPSHGSPQRHRSSQVKNLFSGMQVHNTAVGLREALAFTDIFAPFEDTAPARPLF